MMDPHSAKAEEYAEQRSSDWFRFGRDDLIEHLRTQTGAGTELLDWLDSQPTLFLNVGKRLQRQYGPGGFFWKDIEFSDLMDAIAREQLRDYLFEATCKHALQPSKRIQHLDTIARGER